MKPLHNIYVYILYTYIYIYIFKMTLRLQHMTMPCPTINGNYRLGGRYSYHHFWTKNKGNAFDNLFQKWQGIETHGAPIQKLIYIYIYTLGAGGSPKVLWVGNCECSKIVISLWWNVSFWRSHFLHRMVFCADENFLIRALIDEKSIIHTFILARNVWFVW